jgi:hypothetical protein
VYLGRNGVVTDASINVLSDHCRSLDTLYLNMSTGVTVTESALVTLVQRLPGLTELLVYNRGRVVMMTDWSGLYYHFVQYSTAATMGLLRELGVHDHTQVPQQPHVGCSGVLEQYIAMSPRYPRRSFQRQKCVPAGPFSFPK